MRPDEIESTELYYFGIWGQPGANLWNGNRQGIRPPDVPSIFHPDKLNEKYCRNPGGAWVGDEPEGLAFYHQIEIAEGVANDAPFVGKKWTIIGFNDRSGEDRSGGNSAFLAQGVFTFQQMVILARAQFPDVWKRITAVFEVQDIRTIK